jgi:hypothetical protein
MTAGLRVEDTVLGAELHHRLALGVSWIDGVTQIGAYGPLTTILENIGIYYLHKPFDRHNSDRFALRYAGLIKKRLDKAFKDGLSTDCYVVGHGSRQMGQAIFDSQQDVRIYVPRRLQMAVVFTGSEPAPTPSNIRTPWLWPGATYPFHPTATLIRGRVRRGATLATSTHLRWARIFATIPQTEAIFNQATVVGCGHGDDRGEFVLVLDARAVSGASLKNPVLVRLWAFVPPPPAQIDPRDSFLGLPLENGGTAAINDVLRGRGVPTEYTLQQSKILELRLGETRGGPDTTFLFAP